MALEGGIPLVLLSQEQYKQGKIGDHIIQAVFQAITRIQPSDRALGSAYTRAVFTNVNSVAQQVKASAGRVYRLRIENGSTDAIVVDVLDGTVLRKRQFCPAGTSATVTANAEECGSTDTKGVGTEYDTSINLKAFLATNGVTTAAANVTVKIDFE